MTWEAITIVRHFDELDASYHHHSPALLHAEFDSYNTLAQYIHRTFMLRLQHAPSPALVC
jgi:hypothetical protein